jgi:hypothetical protein
MRRGYLSGYTELGLMIMLFGAKLFGKSIRCLKILESPIQVIEISTRASYNFEKLRLYTLVRIECRTSVTLQRKYSFSKCIIYLANMERQLILVFY